MNVNRALATGIKNHNSQLQNKFLRNGLSPVDIYLSIVVRLENRLELLKLSVVISTVLLCAQQSQDVAELVSDYVYITQTTLQCYARVLQAKDGGRGAVE